MNTGTAGSQVVVGSTIVCAVDTEDAGTRRPLEVAADLAERLDRPLVAAFVVPPGFLTAGGPAPASEQLVVGPGPTVPYPYPVVPAGELEEVRGEARRRLEQRLDEYGVTGAQIEVALDASVPDGLRRVAAERGAELLVVGSRGHGAVRAALLGSTSHALAGDAPCPVVVVPTAD